VGGTQRKRSFDFATQAPDTGAGGGAGAGAAAGGSRTELTRRRGLSNTSPRIQVVEQASVKSDTDDNASDENASHLRLSFDEMGLLSSSPPLAAATGAPTAASSTTVLMSTTELVVPPPPLAVDAVTIRPFLVTVPHLKTLKCVTLVNTLHAAATPPEEFKALLHAATFPVLVRARSNKTHDVRDLLLQLYTSRYVSLQTEASTRFFVTTQQFFFPTRALLTALFSEDQAVRDAFVDEKKHIMCTFCGSEFSLRNNSPQYVDVHAAVRPHDHDRDENGGLHKFLSRILKDRLWAWSLPSQPSQQ
jgi:hypothetical protein